MKTTGFDLTCGQISIRDAAARPAVEENENTFGEGVMDTYHHDTAHSVIIIYLRVRIYFILCKIPADSLAGKREWQKYRRVVRNIRKQNGETRMSQKRSRSISPFSCG